MVGLLVHIIFLYVSYPKENNRFSGRLPFSVYLGWISVALMANISFVLKYYEWDGFGLGGNMGTVITCSCDCASRFYTCL